MQAVENLNTTHNNRAETFSKLTQQVHVCLKKENINIQASHSGAYEHFKKLGDDIQSQQIALLEQYVEVCEDLQKEGESLCNSPLFVWKMLQKMGLKANFDIFEHIGPTDIIEIYNYQNVQVYRNLFFFQICSYSFDELLSIPWWQLFRRDDQVSQLIFANGSAIFRKDINEWIAPEIPEHLLEEIASTEMLKMNVKIKLMAPLVNKTGEIYCLVIEKAKLLNFN